jgi:hypothetical protein
VKFTEGAWLVVVLFPILFFSLIRLNKEYRTEAEVLERISDRHKPPPTPNFPRRTVFLFVDSFDLATLAGLRYAKSQRPTTLRAVHFVIDTSQADLLREEWTRASVDVALDLIDCPDRRLARCAAELVSGEAAQPGTQVTVVLPRRSYSALLGRLLHDRTADKIAAVVSQIPNSAATIVPFDVRSRLEVLQARQAVKERTAAGGAAPDGASRPAGAPTASVAVADPAPPSVPTPEYHSYDRPTPSAGVSPIGSLDKPGRATVEGRIRAVEIRPVERSSVLAADVADSTGDLTALFYGRSHIPGIVCGARVRFRGQVGIRNGGPVMINPAYELLFPGTAEPGDTAGGDGDRPGT